MSANAGMRVGRVSAVDYEKGMVRVTYPDKDNAVSPWLSVATNGDEYKMPKIGSNVCVSMLDTAGGRGVVMGGYWNKGKNSASTGPGVYRKEMGQEQGESYFEFKNGVLTIKAAYVNIQGQFTINGVSCNAGE